MSADPLVTHKTIRACGQIDELFIRCWGADLVGCRIRDVHRRTLPFCGQIVNKHTAATQSMEIPLAEKWLRPILGLRHGSGSLSDLTDLTGRICSGAAAWSKSGPMPARSQPDAGGDVAPLPTREGISYDVPLPEESCKRSAAGLLGEVCFCCRGEGGRRRNLGLHVFVICIGGLRLLRWHICPHRIAHAFGRGPSRITDEPKCHRRPEMPVVFRGRRLNTAPCTGVDAARIAKRPGRRCVLVLAQ